MRDSVDDQEIVDAFRGACMIIPRGYLHRAVEELRRALAEDMPF